MCVLWSGASYRSKKYNVSLKWLQGLFVMLVLCCPILLISPGQNFTGNPTPPPASSSTRHMFVFRVTLALLLPMKATSCLNQPVFQTVLYDVKRKYLFFRKFILFFLRLGPQGLLLALHAWITYSQQASGNHMGCQGPAPVWQIGRQVPYPLYYCLSPWAYSFLNFFPF